MLTVNKLANDDTPDGLHRMQYAAHILEELCGMPAKGNQEVVADCILALSKSKKLSIKQAHDYLARAVRLAQEQGIIVNRFFFTDALYLSMRPVTNSVPEIDRKKLAEQKAATAREQASPEWQALSEQARQKWREIAGIKVMDVKHTKEELLAQAERLGRR